MDQNKKELFQKYIQGNTTAEEMEEVVSLLRNSTECDSDLLPEEEEVLKMVERKKLRPEVAGRIYRNIMAFSPGRRKNKPVLRRISRNLLAAALLTGIICGAYFFGEDFQKKDMTISAPAEGFVTLELENGQETILSSQDSVQLTDAGGSPIGYKKGSRIVLNSGKEETTLSYNTIKVPYGKRIELSLSDGTRVHLNAGTSFKFPVAFVEGMHREVFLTGEAFFEVSEDKERPFKVHTAGLDIEVLGTQFNVEAYRDTPTEEVVLLEGSVKVKHEGLSGMVMAPDQKLSFNGSALEKTAVKASDLISWKDGYLTLNAASTAETVALLERYYNIRIRSEEQQDPEKIVGSGKIYLSEGVDNVISTLALLTNNTYSYQYSQESNNN